MGEEGAQVHLLIEYISPNGRGGGATANNNLRGLEKTIFRSMGVQLTNRFCVLMVICRDERTEPVKHGFGLNFPAGSNFCCSFVGLYGRTCYY